MVPFLSETKLLPFKFSVRDASVTAGRLQEDQVSVCGGRTACQALLDDIVYVRIAPLVGRAVELRAVVPQHMGYAFRFGILEEILEVFEHFAVFDCTRAAVETEESVFADNNGNSFGNECIVDSVNGSRDIVYRIGFKLGVARNVYAERPESIEVDGGNNIESFRLAIVLLSESRYC